MLSPSRQIGMTVGAIPLTEVLAYMQMFVIEQEDERRELLRYVQVLDRVFLDHVKKEEEEVGLDLSQHGEPAYVAEKV